MAQIPDYSKVISGANDANTPDTTTLKDLESDCELWYKIHVFLYDLRRWKECPDSQDRLELVFDDCYLGAPYFTEEEVAKTKSLAVGGTTLAQRLKDILQERLERRLAKRVESNDYRVCAAHDVAPVYESAFNIKEKELSKNKKFVNLVSSCGLELGDNNFTGIKQSHVAVSHQQQKQQRKKR